MKEGARQLLTNRLGHGKIKFIWDPLYIPAKKRLSDRVKSRHEVAQPSYFHFHYNLNFPLPLQPKLEVRLGYKINYVNVLAENEVTEELVASHDEQVEVQHEAQKYDLVADYGLPRHCGWWIFIVGLY